VNTLRTLNAQFLNLYNRKGTSALFLLTEQVTLDKVDEALKGETAELIRSNLSNEQEAKLRKHFSVA
jgi:uncharacterized membrane protein